MKKLFLFLSLCFFLYAAAMLIQTTNMDMGLAVFFMLSVFFFLLFYKYQTMMNLFKKYRKTTTVIITLAILFAGTLETLILLSANTNPDKVSDRIDTVLILGGGTKNNRPGAVLKGRLDQALAYAQNHKDLHFVVSGGLGFRKTESEGFIMKNYLVKHGMDPDRIKIEEKATSTYENLLYTKQMIDPGSKVLIVTSDFHLFGRR